MNAESKAPKLAIRPARWPVSWLSVAPGDWGCFDAQQSAAGFSPEPSAAAALSACSSVAPGDWGCFDAQPPAMGSELGIDSSDILYLNIGRSRYSCVFTSASKPCSLIFSINSATDSLPASYVTNNKSRSSSDSQFRSHSSSTDSTPSSSARACLTLFGQSPHKICSS